MLFITIYRTCIRVADDEGLWVSPHRLYERSHLSGTKSTVESKAIGTWYKHSKCVYACSLYMERRNRSSTYTLKFCFMHQLEPFSTVKTSQMIYHRGGWDWASNTVPIKCYGTQAMDNSRICHCLLFHERGKQYFVLSHFFSQWSYWGYTHTL